MRRLRIGCGLSAGALALIAPAVFHGADAPQREPGTPAQQFLADAMPGPGDVLHLLGQPLGGQQRVGMDGRLATSVELDPALLQRLRAATATRRSASTRLAGTEIAAGGLVSPPRANAGIPAPLIAAYQSAARTIAERNTGCGISWQALAGVGQVESGHAHGGRVDAAGTTIGALRGPRLDGSAGRAHVLDTDDGRIDGDAVFDRAAGAMQLIPRTWRRYGADGNGDGRTSPHNVFDSALAVANALCLNGGDLSQPEKLAHALFAFRASNSFVRDALAWSSSYSRGVRPSAAQDRAVDNGHSDPGPQRRQGPLPRDFPPLRLDPVPGADARVRATGSAGDSAAGRTPPRVGDGGGATTTRPPGKGAPHSRPPGDGQQPIPSPGGPSSPAPVPTQIPTEPPTGTPTEPPTEPPSTDPEPTPDPSDSPDPSNPPDSSTPPEPSPEPEPTPEPTGQPTPEPTSQPNPTTSPTAGPHPTSGPESGVSSGKPTPSSRRNVG